MTEVSATELRALILADFEQLMEHVAQWRQLELVDVEVTMPQARCLLLVGIRPSLSISTLASQLHIGLPAASGLVERLVEAGYVERNVDPNDRRQQLVTLSERGRVLVDRFHELSSARLSDLLRGLSCEELRGLCVGVAALEREARAFTVLNESIHPERTPA
jgi:DNA-binding MarR family transcriptional regulator